MKHWKFQNYVTIGGVASYIETTFKHFFFESLWNVDFKFKISCCSFRVIFFVTLIFFPPNKKCLLFDYFFGWRRPVIGGVYIMFKDLASVISRDCSSFVFGFFSDSACPHNSCVHNKINVDVFIPKKKKTNMHTCIWCLYAWNVKRKKCTDNP